MRISDWSSDVCSSDLINAWKHQPRNHNNKRGRAESRCWRKVPTRSRKFGPSGQAIQFFWPRASNTQIDTVCQSHLSIGSLLSTLLLVGELDTVVLLVPLPERSSVNLHNGVLDEGLCSHKLVVAGVLANIQNTGLVGVHCIDTKPHTHTRKSEERR